MKSVILSGWNYMRILRLVTGAIAMAYAISSHDKVLGLAGGFLLLMAVFNIGCCGAGGCGVPGSPGKKKITDKDLENITYEEVGK